MQNEDRDSIEYQARLFKDKAIIPLVEEELSILVKVILGDKRTLDITHYKDVTYADGEVKKFDTYPSCKSNLKQFCPSKETNYKGYIKELGYVFYGNSRTAIYCDVIKRFVGDRVITPLSY